MKKSIVLLLCLMFIGSLITPAVSYNIGDVVGHTVYTDIIASINDYNIASFNINGYTAVVAEDLRNYGFDVQWIPEQKALYITRSLSNTVSSTYIAPQISANQVGQFAQAVL